MKFFMLKYHKLHTYFEFLDLSKWNFIAQMQDTNLLLLLRIICSKRWLMSKKLAHADLIEPDENKRDKYR